jgi:hypothetical protein
MTLAVAVLLSSCAESPPSAKGPNAAAQPPDAASRSGSSSTGAQLLRDIEASGPNYEISENKGSGGLGKYAVRVDGKSVWPPQGDGCEKLVQCCNAVAAIADPLALSCLLAVGHDHDCGAARRTVAQITLEQGVPLPPSCAPRTEIRDEPRR